MLWAVITTGCLLYLFSGHATLVKWYLGLNNCFYHCQNWSIDFFTPGIKSDGNMYCVITIIVAYGGLFATFKKLKAEHKTTSRFKIKIAFPELLIILLLLIITSALWYAGNKNTLPAHDEIFSAFNSAGIHPFQTMSYYMLPNNHVFFNLLNALIFHSSLDKVATGRLISLAAYCSFVIAVFYWFKFIIKKQWLAFFVSIALALQCPVWGFSFQARGYELCLLAGWGMIISLFSYLQTQQKYWLTINVLCCCTGYFCMPSFLYLHAAQLLFVLLYTFLYKPKETSFWKYQFAAAGITYLLYLPLLCFSGLASLAANGYVAPMSGFKQRPLGDFLQWMWMTFQSYVTHIFSNVHLGTISFDLVLYLVPLALLFRRKNKFSVMFGLFYVLMWAVFFILVIVMKRLPFERNLIAHYSITLAGVILVVEWITSSAAKKTSLQIPLAFVFVLVVISFAYHFFTTNDTFIKVTLYEHDVDATYKELSKGLEYIPPGSTVAFSDEGFFYRYICMKNGCKISNCPTGSETFYVTENYEQMPQAFSENYEMVKSLGDHAIYKRK